MIPFVNIHTHFNKSIANKEFVEIQNIDIDDIANVDVSCFYSIGVHPWSLSQQTTDSGQQSLSHLSDLVTHRLGDSNFLAIGECGLDRACRHDFEAQKKLFIKHIELSEQYNKPLIIHCVRAYPDIISIRKETKTKQPWIIHGFQANEQVTSQLIKHDGISLSLGDVLFKNAEKSRLLLEMIPLEKLFLETDVAERAIDEVYEKVASILDVDIDKLRNEIFNNFVKIFGQI